MQNMWGNLQVKNGLSVGVKQTCIWTCSLKKTKKNFRAMTNQASRQDSIFFSLEKVQNQKRVLRIKFRIVAFNGITFVGLIISIQLYFGLNSELVKYEIKRFFLNMWK